MDVPREGRVLKVFLLSSRAAPCLSLGLLLSEARNPHPMCAKLEGHRRGDPRGTAGHVPHSHQAGPPPVLREKGLSWLAWTRTVSPPSCPPLQDEGRKAAWHSED